MPVLVKPQHELFCQLVSQGKSVSEAYKLAGYVPDPCHANAYRLHNKPAIQRRIMELRERAALAVDISRPRILAELARIAFFNPGDCLEIGEDGKAVLDLTGLDVEQSSALDIVVEIDDAGKAKTKVRLADTATRKTALELLGKHLGMWVERTEHGQAGDFTGIENTKDLVKALRSELGEAEAQAFAAMMSGLDRDPPSGAIN